MGFFSFKTSDTKRSISNSSTSRKPFRVIMQDNIGNSWYEDDYEGYGVFGGKDIYELISEMNGYGTNRNKGILLDLGNSGLKNINTNKIFLANNVDFFNWGTEILTDGKTANELLATGDWTQITVFEDNIKFPLLVEVEVNDWYNSRLISCKYQGFFYD